MEGDFRLSFYATNSHCLAMNITVFAVPSRTAKDFKSHLPEPGDYLRHHVCNQTNICSTLTGCSALRRVVGKRQHFPLAGNRHSRISEGSHGSETGLQGVDVWKSSGKWLLFI